MENKKLFSETNVLLFAYAAIAVAYGILFYTKYSHKSVK